MKARFENRKMSGRSHTSAHKYENLHNLPHWHMEYELIFADYGSAKVTVNSEQYHLKRGHCLFIGSGEVHNIQSLTESRISVIKIEKKLVDSAFDGKMPVCPLIRTDSPLASLFDELAEEYTADMAFGALVGDCLILKALAMLFRCCELRKTQSTGGNEKYKALLTQIEERYADITFDEAAEFMCYSKPYFSRYFSSMTGMTFSAYLNIIRVAEAVSMIGEGRYSITEIAHATGFGTIRHFNRVFRELTGYSPRELPEEYVFIQYRADAASEGFDPTLSAPAIL